MFFILGLLVLIVFITMIAFRIGVGNANKNNDFSGVSIEKNEVMAINGNEVYAKSTESSEENDLLNNSFEIAKCKVEEFAKQYYSWFFEDEMKIYRVCCIKKEMERFAFINSLALYAKNVVKLKPIIEEDDTEILAFDFDVDDYETIDFFKFVCSKLKLTTSITLLGVQPYEIKGNLYRRNRKRIKRNEKDIANDEKIDAILEKIKTNFQITNEQVMEIINLLIEKQVIVQNIELYNRYENIEYKYGAYRGINNTRFRKIYKSIEMHFYDEGLIEKKWKHEYELFKLVQKYYSDAIYQYRVMWLGAQSIDIFIPTLNLAIEYQGAQHYKAVEIFGGEEGFKATQIRDERKRNLCKENGVILLEWKYTVEITDEEFKRQVEKITGIVPQKQEGNSANIFYEDYIDINYYNMNMHICDYSSEELMKAIDIENNYVVYCFLIYFLENGLVNEIESTLCYMIDLHPESSKSLLCTIINQEQYCKEILSIIAKSKKLVRGYLNTDKFNMYYRSVVIFAIQNGYSSEELVELLNDIKKRQGESEFKRFAPSLLDEIDDGNYLEAEKILKQVGII